ncbi:MAG: type II/IV secretion system protein [Burkholderiales bacterium]|nr:type II/IV secretion system protein [Burkholderiales bacterium]
MSAVPQLKIVRGAAAEEEFRWPAPSYFEFVREQDRLDWADCLLTLRDGTRTSGRAHSFVPGEALLEFQPDGAGKSRSVAFSSLLKLQLGRSVPLRRETAPTASTAQTEAAKPTLAETQPFRIELANGEIFDGVTLGYVSALCGLFLYLPQDDGGVLRCFVPANAAQNCSIDAPIGQILINQRAASPEAVGAALNLQAIMRTKKFEQFLAQSVTADEESGGAAAPEAQNRRVLSVCDTQSMRWPTGNPEETAALEQLRRMTQGRRASDVVAAEDESENSFIRRYSSTTNSGRLAASAPRNRREVGEVQVDKSAAITDRAGVQELVTRLAAETGDRDVTEQHAAKSSSALVLLVNRIILDAVEHKASDIHIESNLAPKTTRVRFRRDGVLVNYLELPSQFRNALVSRIKIMSNLDITERRKPQDGKIDFSRFGPAKVELRIATVPTTGNLEDVVMRLLSANNPVGLDELGMEEHMLEAISGLISKPHGLFLVCGPTGSGKTTTLHSLLGFLNTLERKIWTAEDPIEITQAGLRQVQVNPKIGWTFAAAMRSFMRADPDVIMVGEMRDGETAKIGIEASLTGHLVLSTLHTNSAAESIVRLLDLGMDPFNFSDALLGVLSQRLAKRLCPECKSAYAPTPAELDTLLREYCNSASIDTRTMMQKWLERHGNADGTITLYRAQGCTHCDNTGYRGRIGVHELLVADATTKQLIQSRAPLSDVRNAAAVLGMSTLRQDGIEKILQGLTDIRQINAVCS